MPHSKTYKKYNTTPTPELKAVEFYKGHTSERRVSTQSDRACKPEASRITWKHYTKQFCHYYSSKNYFLAFLETYIFIHIL